MKKIGIAVVLAATLTALGLTTPSVSAATSKTKTIPVYRMYNPNSGEHFYTENYNERTSLVNQGWNCEGTGWYAPEKSTVPVYRLYNPNAGNHFYTENQNEKNNLVSKGWNYEGIDFYSGGSVSTYRAYNPNSGLHNFTTNNGEQASLVSLGWKNEGTAWKAEKVGDKKGAKTGDPIAALRGKKLIALTFDDGPSPSLTPQLLSYLRQANVHATFFEVGQMIQQAPQVTQEAARDGNEIASHTWDHADLTKLSQAAAAQEINSTSTLIKQLTGQDNPIFRPPYGAYNSSVLNATNKAAIYWSTDSEDWRNPGTPYIVNYEVSHAFDGDIILLHDIHAGSVAAVPQTISQLKAQGYTFVTVSQLLTVKYGGITPHTVYFK